VGIGKVRATDRATYKESPVTNPTGPSTPTEPTPIRPIKQYSKHWADRVGNVIFRGLATIGVGPASMLTTTGRRTGQSRSTPVIPVRHGARQWLVSPYGEVPWLLNARASGHVGLRRGRDMHSFTVREVSAVEAGPILKQYVAVASATRRYFRADRAAPISEFVAEAALHPVLELTQQ
jgi:deazaflavin-dependent oxidoreductase (nitroreductase family)